MNNLINLLNSFKYPLLTEKSINLYGNGQYTFLVNKCLTKTEIKYIVEKVFNVKVTNVNSCNLPTKTRRVGKFLGKRTQYKKTFVRLQKGDTIAELFN